MSLQHQFDVNIAAQFGIPEAVFVHRVYLLVLANEANGRNEHEGRYWTYDSAKAICSNCPYWSPRQVEGIIQRCRDKGLILTAKLSDNSYDRTNWYTVTDLVQSIYAKTGMESRENRNRDTQKPECLNEQRKTKERPKREGAPVKNAYGEFGNVKLTDAELDKLLERWDDAQVSGEIEALSAYMRSKGKRYVDHYATLLNWLKRDFPSAGKTKLIEEDWANE